MPRFSSIALSTALIGAGVIAWALAARPLLANPELNVPLNPLGIQRSPYGEVVAMALQGPIDTFWDADLTGKTTEIAPEPKPTPVKKDASWHARLDAFLTSLDDASTARTNPNAASDALKRHLRREIENKLRFAYQFDPAHYGNYNSLHFFLTEPALATRSDLTASAVKLADDTIHYCLQQDHDPRPALTAAAAATNVLQLMFNDSLNGTPKFTTTQMRQYLVLLDDCLARYSRIAQDWDLSKQWQLLSLDRIAECEERIAFIRKIRDAAEATIARLEKKPLSQMTIPSRAAFADVVQTVTHLSQTHGLSRLLTLA